MLPINLPVVKLSIDETTKQLIKEKKEIQISIDTSIFAEERWEINFPENAKKETVFAYIERVKESGLIEDKALILSHLKALYCFVEGSEIADFKSFCQLFDWSDEEILNKLIEKIKFAFNLVLSQSAANSKN